MTPDTAAQRDALCAALVAQVVSITAHDYRRP